MLCAVCDAQAFVMTAEVKERTLVGPKEGATCGVHSLLSSLSVPSLPDERSFGKKGACLSSTQLVSDLPWLPSGSVQLSSSAMDLALEACRGTLTTAHPLPHPLHPLPEGAQAPCPPVCSYLPRIEGGLAVLRLPFQSCTLCRPTIFLFKSI